MTDEPAGATRTINAATPAPPPPPLGHGLGCTECGTTNFGVEFREPGPGPGRVEDRRMNGRCWECHEARSEGARGLQRRGWRILTGLKGWPADLDAYPRLVPRFADHTDAEPTVEPWGFVDRAAWLAIAVATWPHRTMWPPDLHDLIPPRPTQPPEPQRPCRWCGTTGARAYVWTRGWFPTCDRCDAAVRGDGRPYAAANALPGLAAAAIGLTRPLGTLDLDRLHWRWFREAVAGAEQVNRPDPAGSPEPFGYLDLSAMRSRALVLWPEADHWEPSAYAAATRDRGRA